MTGPTEPEGHSQPFEPMPTAPPLGEPDVAPVAVERPTSVNTAFILWLVIGLLLLVSLVLFLAVSSADLEDQIRQGLERSGRTLTDQEIKDGAAGYRVLAIGLNLVFAVLILAFAFVLRAGRNWARITLTALGGIVVILGLFGFGGNFLITLLELVVGAIAVVFMFRKDSNRYFAAGRAPR